MRSTRPRPWRRSKDSRGSRWWRPEAKLPAMPRAGSAHIDATTHNRTPAWCRYWKSADREHRAHIGLQAGVSPARFPATPPGWVGRWQRSFSGGFTQEREAPTLLTILKTNLKSTLKEEVNVC